MNGSKGLNRRSCVSIKLCIEKNSLKNQIKICDDRSEQQSLQALLKGVMAKLRNMKYVNKNKNMKYEEEESLSVVVDFQDLVRIWSFSIW